jgi:hypothetical protein
LTKLAEACAEVVEAWPTILELLEFPVVRRITGYAARQVEQQMGPSPLCGARREPTLE